MADDDGYEYLHKILLIGNSAVGKSSLMRRFCDNIFEEQYMFTIGVDFKIKTIMVQDTSLKLQIWDTAGQERFKTITSAYYKGSEGVMLVYSITDRGSFDSIENWMKEVVKQASGSVILFLVGNKADCESKREVSYEEGAELAKNLGLNFLETSAKHDMNVEKAFFLMAEQLQNAFCMHPDKGRIEQFDRPRGKKILAVETQKSINKKKKKGCCQD